MQTGGYKGIMEKNMETVIMGYNGLYRGFIGLNIDATQAGKALDVN